MVEILTEDCLITFKDGEVKARMHIPLYDRAKKLAPSLKEKLGLKNIMSVPRLLKVTINRGIGDVKADKRKVDVLTNELSNIAGQKAVVVTSKKSISNFKLREGDKIGVMVTLRGKKMYDFVDKLISIVLPRTRDFRGLSTKSFDKTGVFNIGIKDQTVFLEIPVNSVEAAIGMNITFVTSSHVKEHNMALFEAFGFPFNKN